MTVLDDHHGQWWLAYWLVQGLFVAQGAMQQRDSGICRLRHTTALGSSHRAGTVLQGRNGPGHGAGSNRSFSARDGVPPASHPLFSPRCDGVTSPSTQNDRKRNGHARESGVGVARPQAES